MKHQADDQAIINIAPLRWRIPDYFAIGGKICRPFTKQPIEPAAETAIRLWRLECQLNATVCAS
jgi:hypothetical protein